MIVRPLVCPALVGRREELDELVSARKASARGHGALVLVAGEAGIGKTRLVAALRDTISHGRAAAAVGLCREYGNVPYGPVVDALRRLGSRFVPSAAPTRAEQLAGMVAELDAICRRRSVVLVIEDLQWADEGTLQFLLHVMPKVPSMRVLIVATHRADVRRGDVAESYIARLARFPVSRRIALTPLSAGQMRDLVRLTLRDLPPLSGSDVDRIVERSEGNPFFAEELLKSALERDRRSQGTDRLPLTIRAAVTERLALLDADARRVLVLAAVLGRRFEARFLADLARRPLAEVLEVLRRVRDLQLVDERPGDDASFDFTFRHELTRAAVYDEMLVAEVRPLHGTILAALEARGNATASVLGYHAWAALDAAKCALYNERAGDEADALHAYADAVRCYERAMQLSHDDVVVGRLLQKSAESCSRDGNAARALHLYQSAAEAYARAGHDDHVAELYQAMSAEARHAGDNAYAARILEKALDAAAGASPRSRASLTLMLAYTHLDRGESSVADELIRGVSGAADLPAYHNTCGYAAIVRADVDGLRRATARYVASCERLGLDRVLQARFNGAFGLCVLGQDAEALASFDAFLPELEKRRLSSLTVLSYANAALIEARAGRLDAARELVERGLAVPEPATTAPIALAAAVLAVGNVTCDAALVARGVSAEVVEAAFSSRINTTLGRLAGPYARWLRARGDRDGACAVLRRAVEALSAPVGATETVIAASELGDDATRRAVEPLVAAAEEMSHLPIYAATALHARACASLASGDAATAARLAGRSAAEYRRLGWVLHEARARELAGDVSMAVYRDAGATADLRRLEAASRGRGRARATLSQREREIATLVAGGTPNKALAERLDVSQRTVEKHLTSIYVKLGLRNRSELAAFIARAESGV